MKRNLFVSYENFRGRTLTRLVRGYEGRTNPVQLKRFMQSSLNCEVHSILSWSLYEDDEEVEQPQSIKAI